MSRRQALACFAALLSLAVSAACGSGGSSSRSAATGHPPPRRSATTYSTNDGDQDYDDEARYRGRPQNDEIPLLASYGPKASAADTAAVSSIVKRYYVASARGDGEVACSMLTARLAEGLASQAGKPGDRRACSSTMSRLLAQQRKTLHEDEASSMIVTAVRTNGTLALAALAFRTAPEGEIVLEHEDGVWKIDALFGGYMT